MSNELPAGPLKRGLTLYLVRHGETDWNRDARYQGQRDIPLNDIGRAQARRHGKLLKELVPGIADFDFVSSPLGRAIETMKLIRSELGVDPDGFRTDSQIQELSYGHWEGQLAAELPQKDPRGVSEKASDPYGWRPAGGESYGDLHNRVAAWLATLEKNTIAVTHGGVSRVARGAIFEISPVLVPFLEVPQDKVLKLADGVMQWL